MDHAAGVGVGQGLTDLLEDFQEAGQILSRRRALRQQGGEGPSFDQLHGEVGPLAGQPAEFVNGDDAGVLQLAADLGLLPESPNRLGVVLVVLPQHLDGQVAAEVRVVP